MRCCISGHLVKQEFGGFLLNVSLSRHQAVISDCQAAASDFSPTLLSLKEFTCARTHTHTPHTHTFSLSQVCSPHFGFQLLKQPQANLENQDFKPRGGHVSEGGLK